jgi:ribonuclease J
VVRIRIHRGSKEIGGSCIEVESSGVRIVLDLGLPLDAPDLASIPLPDIAGLTETSSSLLAIVLSHGHRDHWGLMPKVRSEVPFVMGRATSQILKAALDFVPDTFSPVVSKFLAHRETLEIGPFKLTPYLVDHSGFDAYAMTVEADNQRLFYSGDFRAHGRKARMFDALLNDPPGNIDLMLMEGSSLGRLDEHQQFPTEQEIEEIFVDRFRHTSGMALVACSAQNIDRVVSVYRACKRTGRVFLIDAYAAEILKAIDRDSIPKPTSDWSNIAVYLPQSQRRQLVRKGIASIVDSYRGLRIWPNELSARAGNLAMLFRGWMLGDLEKANALQGARVIWSQWDGYLKDGSGKKLIETCALKGIPFEVVHTSGHASPSDLKRLASAIAPKKLVPIHTFEREKFPAMFENVSIHNDGEWIEVANGI